MRNYMFLLVMVILLIFTPIIGLFAQEDSGGYQLDGSVSVVTTELEENGKWICVTATNSENNSADEWCGTYLNGSVDDISHNLVYGQDGIKKWRVEVVRTTNTALDMARNVVCIVSSIRGEIAVNCEF